MMTQPNNTDVNRSSWRSIYQVHPCADVFPMMSDPELDALAADIKEHGLQKPILMLGTWDQKKGSRIVLDGRNRLEALARLGATFDPECPEASDLLCKCPFGSFEFVEHVDRRRT